MMSRVYFSRRALDKRIRGPDFEIAPNQLFPSINARQLHGSREALSRGAPRAARTEHQGEQRLFALA